MWARLSSEHKLSVFSLICADIEVNYQAMVLKLAVVFSTTNPWDMEVPSSVRSNPGEWLSEPSHQFPFSPSLICSTESSRCPVEDDQLLLGDKRPLITGSETHTVFIKVWALNWSTFWHFVSSIWFSHFGDHFDTLSPQNSIRFSHFGDSGWQVTLRPHWW